MGELLAPNLSSSSWQSGRRDNDNVIPHEEVTRSHLPCYAVPTILYIYT